MPLPSPTAALSPAPPLGGGATASREGIAHRVSAATVVRVAVDPAGRPIRVESTQKLRVRGLGDYVFTIGAPVLDVRAAPGSASTPGFRDGAILWQGFDPGSRLLAATATLAPSAAARALPLRIERVSGGTRIENATRVSATALRGDGSRAALLDYLARLRAALTRGSRPPAGTVDVAGTVSRLPVQVTAPLAVSGTIGGRPVHLRLTGAVTVGVTGAVRLRAVPVFPRIPDLSGAPTARLLEQASRIVLTVARVGQYRAFLGNPDPAGRSSTVYDYRSGARAAAPAGAALTGSGGGVRTLLVALALAAAAGLGLVVWARS